MYNLKKMREIQVCPLKENNEQFPKYVKYIDEKGINQVWRIEGNKFQTDLLYVQENNKHKLFKILSYALTAYPYAQFINEPLFEAQTKEELIEQLELNKHLLLLD